MTRHASSLLFIALAAGSTLTPEVLAAAPRYQMGLDRATPEHGVKTVSLVENPAIQRGWVALSAVDPTAPKRFHLSEATEGAARQVLTGPALLPGQEILRLDAKGEPFFIVFTEATIEDTARQFAAQGHHNSTNQDHATALAGNVIYESWIVADPAKDKAAALGLNVPTGTWMLSVHIPDADYWQNEVVTGNKTGFSIEGLFEQQQLTLSAAKPTALSSMKDWFKNLTAKLSKEKAAEVAVALGVAQLADGRAVSIDDTTGAVTVAGVDGQPGEVLADGTYPLAAGGELVVKDGKRAEPTAPVDPTTVDAAAPVAVAPLEPTATLADVVAAINQLIAGTTKPAENPASDPAAPKLATALHGVKLEALGEKLTELKLDAIKLTEGDELTYNAVSRRLSDAKGALVESGYYAAADGSYFQVSTSQYIWEIDKQTYDMVYGAKLQAVELADAKAKLAKEPAARPVNLHADNSADKQPEALLPHQAFLQSVRQSSGKQAA
jgi:hypothetical protein